MKIRATVKLRNDAMISAREKKGWSQIEAASIIDVSLSLYCNLERLIFPKTYRYEEALLIAHELELAVENVLPERMVGWSGRTKFRYIQDVPVERLLEYQNTQISHYLLPSPEEDASESEDMEMLLLMVNECPYMSHKERMYLKLHYGLGAEVKYPHKVEAIAKKFGRSKATIRILIARAIEKLKSAKNNPSFMEYIGRKLNEPNPGTTKRSYHSFV